MFLCQCLTGFLMGGSRKSSGMCVQRPLSDDTLGPSISAMKSKRRNPWHTNTYSILPTDPRIPVLAPSKADPARGALLTYPKDPAWLKSQNWFQLVNPKQAPRQAALPQPVMRSAQSMVRSPWDRDAQSVRHGNNKQRHTAPEREVEREKERDTKLMIRAVNRLKFFY